MFFLPLLVLLTASVPSPCGQNADTSITALREDLATLEQFGFSGAVLIATPGQILLAQGYGTTGAPTGERNTVASEFDIGSLAKQFTAAAIFRLAADHKLRITDSVGRFFPQAPPAIAVIRIDQLLSHTAGLQRDNLVTDSTTELDPLGRDAALARLFQSAPRFTPGSQQAYSNAGYVLLAAIVEQASGVSYRQFLREQLWRSAELSGGHFWGEPGGVLAWGKDELGVIADPRRYPEQDWSLQGAGGIMMSAEDLRRWFFALLDGSVLPDSMVHRMMTYTAGPAGGYGWRVGLIGDDSTSVFHGGDYHGYGSQLIWQPRHARLIIILANVRHEDDTYPTRIPVERAILGRLQGAPVSLPELQPAHRTGPPPQGLYVGPDGARFYIGSSPEGTYLGALNQQATAFVVPALSPDTAAYRAALTDRTVQVLKAALAGDSAALRGLLASTDDPPYVFDQLQQEMRAALDGRTVTDVVGLGTYPATAPKGAFWSVVELQVGRNMVGYMLRWYQDNVASYHHRAPPVAARLPLTPSDDGWIGWDIVRPGPEITVSYAPGNTVRLYLSNGTSSIMVEREEHVAGR